MSVADSTPQLEKTSLDLYAFMPAFNEAETIAQTLRDWITTFQFLSGASGAPTNFLLTVFDDGSTDQTSAAVQSIAAADSRVRLVRGPNQGHGPTLTAGYQAAVASGAAYVFQIDSDGQCDPQYFAQFWHARSNATVILGFRTNREDGQIRKAISKIVALVTFTRTGRWIRDPNVPYRLIARAPLVRVLPAFTARRFSFTNVLLSVRLAETASLAWIPIVFRKRTAGHSTVRLAQMVRHARTLWRELGQLREQRRQRQSA